MVGHDNKQLVSDLSPAADKHVAHDLRDVLAGRQA